MPLTLALQFGDAVQFPKEVVALWMILIGALMVSRVPSFALKGWRVPRVWVAPIFVVAVAVVAGAYHQPVDHAIARRRHLCFNLAVARGLAITRGADGKKPMTKHIAIPRPKGRPHYRRQRSAAGVLHGAEHA